MTEAPTLSQIKAAMISQLSEQQRRLICVWLGMESLERNSADIYDLSKSIIGMIDVKALADDIQFTEGN
jgi:hypothetical protein